MINKVTKILAPQLALMLLLINFGLLIWYLFIGYQPWFHSDSAAKVLIAREIVATGDYFPDDWNFVNKDLFVLFGHTFVLPLLAFIPAGYTAHAISGLISSVLILLGVWLVTELAKIGVAHRLLIVAVVAAGVSGFTAENLFGQVSYGAVLYFTCFTLFFAWQVLIANGRKRIIWGLALLVLMALVFWANPQRALISYALPLVAASVFLLINQNNSVQAVDRKSILALLGFVGLGVLCGVVMHAQTISGVHNVLGAGHARWLSYELMVRNASLLLKGYLAIFGGLPSVDGVVVSKSGLYEATRFLAALALLVLIPVAILRVIQHRNPPMVFFVGFALTAFASVLFIHLTTTVPDMTDPIQSSRYLVVSLILFLLIVTMQPLDFFAKPLLTGAQIVVFGVLLTNAYPAFVMSGPNSDIHWGMPGQLGNGHQVLADYLSKNRLKYGYATYWHAGVISVLSDERSLVRQVVIENGIPMPMRWLSSNRWYRPSAWQGETFLLLTSNEAKLLDLEKMAILGAVPSQTMEFGDYKIYVFRDNIASKLPGWDTRYEKPITFKTNKASLSQTGKLYDNYEGSGPALVAEKGEIGALHFGPYVNVDAGRYLVSFDIRANTNASGVARLDVVAAPDQKIYGEKVLSESHGSQEIVFILDKTRTLEFRVWALGNERVIFRGVTIQRLPESEEVAARHSSRSRGN